MKLPPYRLWIGVMIFFTTFTNYMLRANMSVSIIRMLAKNKSSFIPPCKRDQMTNTTPVSTPTTKKEIQFHWDEKQVGGILSAYFYGYLVSLIPAGAVSEWVGPWHVILWSSVASAVLTALTPQSAMGGYMGIVINRFFVGLCGGLAYPAANVLIAKWAPPEEKGKFMSAMLGNTIGTVVSFGVVGVVTDYWGWEWGIYSVVIIMALYCVTFFFVVADTPEKCRWASQEERDYIAAAQEGHISKRKAVPPYVKILMSYRFWALCAAQFGNLWGLNLILTYAPKYLAETVGFNLKASAGLASLPYLARMFCSGIFGIVGDWMRKKGVMSVTRIRKTFIIFSHFLPAICLFLIRVANCNHAGIIVLLILNQGLNGAVVVSHFINPQDLAPNFTGSLFGMMNFAGMTTGLIVPHLTGALLTEYNHEVMASTIIYTIGGSVYAVGGLIFVLFGTAQVQPWNAIAEAETTPGE